MTIDNTCTADVAAVEIGRRLAHLRLMAGIRQQDLAARAGISRYTLVRLEKGDAGVRIGALLAVLAQLDRLDALSVVLPEPSLSPIQQAKLEAKELSVLPKRVRMSKKTQLSKRPIWGDEE